MWVLGALCVREQDWWIVIAGKSESMEEGTISKM